MRTIKVKIPDKERKRNYALLHVDIYWAILEYLNDIDEWVENQDLENWVCKVQSELEKVRKL